MNDIVKIYQEISKYKKEDETITEFYNSHKISSTLYDDYMVLFYRNKKYEIRYHVDIKKFLTKVFREKKFLRIIDNV